jgi:DNA replicative helicase MCM subunit Mcm2 (Cdc46/Mcm family)
MHQGKAIKKAHTDVSFEILKKYIKYAKSKVNPRLSLLAS